MAVYKKIEAIKNIVNLVEATFDLCEELETTTHTNRRWWVRPVNVPRDSYGFFTTCLQQIERQDEEHFHLATRMSVAQYKMLLSLLKSNLEKHSFRKPLSPGCRLSLTLLYLAHGCSMQVLAWAYKIGVSTVRKVIYETCEVIWNELHEFYLANPNITDWSQISSSFYEKTGLPHCLGAIDGKHISITCPKRSGSLYYNYKKYFSIVLIATCDSNFAFTCVDVGAYGSQSDGGIFRRSKFGKKIIYNELNIPPPDTMPNSNLVYPFYFVGDNAFPLLPNLMRPYPGISLQEDKRNFNKILSKTRCRIEISFGILANRWRVLHTTINASPKNADKIVLDTVLLHNFLILNNDKNYFNCEANEELDQGNLVNIGLLRSNHPTSEAFSLREKLKEYLVTQQ